MLQGLLLNCLSYRDYILPPGPTCSLTFKDRRLAKEQGWTLTCQGLFVLWTFGPFAVFEFPEKRPTMFNDSMVSCARDCNATLRHYRKHTTNKYTHIYIYTHK